MASTLIPQACAHSSNNFGSWIRWAPEIISSPKGQRIYRSSNQTKITGSLRFNGSANTFGEAWRLNKMWWVKCTIVSYQSIAKKNNLLYLLTTDKDVKRITVVLIIRARHCIKRPYSQRISVKDKELFLIPINRIEVQNQFYIIAHNNNKYIIFSSKILRELLF